MFDTNNVQKYQIFHTNVTYRAYKFAQVCLLKYFYEEYILLKLWL